MSRVLHVASAEPIQAPPWRTVILRVTNMLAPGARTMLAGTAHDLARNPDVQDGIRRLAEGELAIVFLGEPTHTSIERAS